MEAQTIIAAAGVVVAILGPMAAFFLHQDRRISRLETLMETLLEVKAQRMVWADAARARGVQR